jgi:hypothetical protein
VGSIPASRTKNESLQRKLQAFSFLGQWFLGMPLTCFELNAILDR